MRKLQKDIQLSIYDANGEIVNLPYWVNSLPMEDVERMITVLGDKYPMVLIVSCINSDGVHKLIRTISTDDLRKAQPIIFKDVLNEQGYYLSYYYEPSAELRETIVEDIYNDYGVPFHIV